MKSRTIEIIGTDKTENLISRLRQSNEHYLIYESSYTLKIKIPELKLNYLCVPDYTSKKSWGTLASIKSQILKANEIEPLDKIEPRKIKYFEYSKNMNLPDNFKTGSTIQFSNVCEMDISAAYITAAKNLKIISPENFQKLKDGPKKNRLKVLGALASQKTVEYWTGPDLIETLPLQVNPVTRNAWFNIVAHVDNVISEIFEKLNNSALFYYVDNLYFYHTKELENFVLNHFKQFDFEMKILPLDNFFIYNSKNGPAVIVKRTNEPQPKVFFIPKPKQITYEIRK